MLDIIQYTDIKKYKRYFPFDLYTNSKLYYDKDLIHKIFFYKTTNFNFILELLDELQLEELVELKNLIYHNGFLVGYSIKNYKEYKSLNKFKNRKLELKKRDCYKIVKSFDKLWENNLSYVDFTTSNILLNKDTNKIKICDLDSIIVNKSKRDEELGIRNLLTFIISYLYKINPIHVKNAIICNENFEDTFIQKCKEIVDNYSLYQILNIISDITYDDIKKEKTLIINKSRELIDTGYPKFL